MIPAERPSTAAQNSGSLKSPVWILLPSYTDEVPCGGLSVFEVPSDETLEEYCPCAEAFFAEVSDAFCPGDAVFSAEAPEVF